MNQEQRARTIVVGVDYSDTSELVLNQAFELATAEPNVELHAIHVVGPLATPSNEYGARLNAEEAEKLREHVSAKLLVFLANHSPRKAPARVVCHVRIDETAREIAQLAADLEADLIVVGTHGRRAVSRLFLGSVA